MNSSAITDALYGFFDLNKTKLIWTGSLEDLKAFVLTEIDEKTAENTTWRSPSGGKWCFHSDQFKVTWYTKSKTIIFDGNKVEKLKEKIHGSLSKSEKSKSVQHPNDQNVEPYESNTAASHNPVDDNEDRALTSLSLETTHNQSVNSNACNDSCPCGCRSMPTGVEIESNIAAGQNPVDDNEDRAASLSPKPTQSVNSNASNDSCPCISRLRATDIDIEGIKLDIVILQSQMTTDSAKSLNAHKEVSKLRFELQKEQHRNVMLEERAAKSEEENDSLRLALKLLMQDQAVRLDPTVVHETEQRNPTTWKTPKGPLRKKHTQSKLIMQDQNRFGALQNLVEGDGYGNAECATQRSTNNKESLVGPNENEIKKRNPKKKKRKQATVSDEVKVVEELPKQSERQTNSRASVVVAGDSIIKYVKGWELSNAEQNVSVKSFSGATVDDMVDFLKPTIRKRPDKLVIHAGTNDVRSSNPKTIADKVIELAENFKEKSSCTEIIISSLVIRCDSEDLAKKVKDTNKLLKLNCDRKHYMFLDNANINRTHLNQRGLHLNHEGSARLQRNIASTLKSLNAQD